jgi:hypothetical protein
VAGPHRTGAFAASGAAAGCPAASSSARTGANPAGVIARSVCSVLHACHCRTSPRMSSGRTARLMSAGRPASAWASSEMLTSRRPRSSSKTRRSVAESRPRLNSSSTRSTGATPAGRRCFGSASVDARDGRRGTAPRRSRRRARPRPQPLDEIAFGGRPRRHVFAVAWSTPSSQLSMDAATSSQPSAAMSR